MKKYKLIVAPSSNDEELFDSASNYREAAIIIESKNVESASEFSFNTEYERECFIQGYKAAIGYNGNGLFWTTEEGSD